MAKKDEWLDVACDIGEVDQIRSEYVAKGWSVVGARLHFFNELRVIFSFSRRVEMDSG